MKQSYWLASIVCCMFATNPAWAAPAESDSSGSLAMSSPTKAKEEFSVFRVGLNIDPQKLRTNLELGLVFSVQHIQTLFSVKAELDINKYAIKLNASSSVQPRQVTATEPPQRAELPRVYLPGVALNAIDQRVNVSGSETELLKYKGDVTGAGTIFGGSWFVRVDQPDLQNRQSWKLAEARIQQQTNRADYIFGSQPPFWRSQAPGDFWGFTTIQRQGFQPQGAANGKSEPRQRLQADQIKRTISGRAESGTLVRLTENKSERVITEVLVDASSIYRFDNVKGGNYRVLLYPQGRLTAQPKIRKVTVTAVPGQLPAGASALIFSGGFRRNLSPTQNLIGDFSDFRGGIAQRWGLSQDLTVGLGGAYDESFRGLGEIFFQPKNFPIQVAVSALAGDIWDVNIDVSFARSPKINASFKSDRRSRNFNLNWEVFPEFTLIGTYDSVDGGTFGGQIAFNGKNASTFARATLDTQNRFRWNLRQRLGRLELSQQGNEIKTLSELTYNFSKTNQSGHALIFNYETRNLPTGSNNLATFVWRYRSLQQAIDRKSLWEVELGFGNGSQGSGLVAKLGTRLIPGLLLQARYQEVSVTSDLDNFSIEVAPSFHLH